VRATELLQAVDVGAVVDLARQDAVAAAVTRQEDELPALEEARDVRVGGRSERCLQAEALHLRQPSIS